MTRRGAGVVMSPKIIAILVIATFILLKVGSPIGLLGFGLLLQRYPAAVAGLCIVLGALALFPHK